MSESVETRGAQKIEWASRHMPVLGRIRDAFETDRPFAGLRVGICLHLEAKTAYLAQVIAAGGAGVAITGSNPFSTQDDVAAALANSGVAVHARHGCRPEEYRAYLHQVLDTEPHLIVDDGADLVHLLHTKRRELLDGVRGGCEETTTGILRLRAMDREGVLAFPMMGVNDAMCKYLFDNRYGTGQSTWDGIMRATNRTIAGATVVVVGYGWCGRGIAQRARGLAARVIVTEVDPFKAIEASMDGFEVMSLDEAAPKGQFIVTATGGRGVVTGRHFERMQDGAVLANAGHFDVEIDKNALVAAAGAPRRVRTGIDEYTVARGRRLYLLGEGGLVNLVCADGHPAEIMDMSFALQALGLQAVNVTHEALGPGFHAIPEAVDLEVARLKLRADGVEIDTLTAEQRAYLDSWKV